MDRTSINIENKKKNTEQFDVLFTVNSDDTKKDYIVYTDNTLDEDNNLKAYAAIYDETGKLTQIKDDREWKTIEELIEKFNKDE